EQWAAQRRKHLGLVELQPKDRLGKLRSTLGAVREERDGASQGTVTQSFPEVYIGPEPNFPLLVNRACKEMQKDWREVIEVHYVILFDENNRRIKVKEKAFLLDLSLRSYWQHLTFGKNFIHSFIICTQNTLANTA